MVFVTLGTQDAAFPRCLEAVESLINRRVITEKVIAQKGHTRYDSQVMVCYDFISAKQYQEYMEEARVVIAHAGTGALFNAIKLRKKVIAVARLSRYNEMINDHQLEILQKLSGGGIFWMEHGIWNKHGIN